MKITKNPLLTLSFDLLIAIILNPHILTEHPCLPCGSSELVLLPAVRATCPQVSA